MVAPGWTNRLPLSASTRPAAILSSVDLPEPLRPIRHTRSPDDTDSSTPDNSGVPPKVSLMSFNWIRGGGIDCEFNPRFAGLRAGAGYGGWPDRARTGMSNGRAARRISDRPSLPGRNVDRSSGFEPQGSFRSILQ